jgi:hypothetical protein
MKYYESTAHIDASPASVWSVLMDGATYPKWDSGVEGVEGSIADGGRITVRSEASPGRAFPVKVQRSEDGSSMTWSGGMPLGLFRGVRTFTVTSTTGTETDFRMREEYSGPLVGLVWKSMPDLGPSFERFARGLKVRSEMVQSNRLDGGG